MWNRKKILIASILLTVLAVVGFFQVSRSKKQVSISFYHWKSEFSPSKHDLNLIQACEVNQLYLHVFDVDRTPGTQVPIPKAKLSFSSNFPPGIAVIPTVFITQRTFEDAANLNIAELAKNIVELSRQITTAQKLVWKGFQIDCDWTAGSKRTYFTFLEALKKELGNEIPLSVTIRLHQIKYPEKTGVPPCDRGVLMYYNMGDEMSESND